MEDFVLQPGFSLDVNMSDYFGLWMVHPDSFRPLVNKYNGVNIELHIKSESAQTAVKQQAERRFSATSDGIAIFRAEGPMMKRPSSMSGGTSTIRLRQQIRQARNDGEITGGLLVMDTPGGTAKGNADLADEVARFAQQKPLLAFVEDLTASAGVSVASQATKIFANNSEAMYGAMGTYAVLMDYSGEAAQLGIRVHVIKAGEFKGMAEPGTQITEAQLEEAQRIVNRLNASYLQMIAQGRQRSVESVEALADGRIIFAADALAQGLIDGVGTFDEALAEVRGMTKSSTSTTQAVVETAQMTAWSAAAGVEFSQCSGGDVQMLPVTMVTTEESNAARVSDAANQTDKEDSEMEPATLQELKQEFPDASSDWVLAQLEAKATILDASKNYAKHVKEQAEQAKAAHDEALKQAQQEHEQELAAAKNATPSQTRGTGFNPLSVDNSDAEQQQVSDPIEAFDAAVLKHMALHNVDRQTASTAVRKRDPELIQAYLLACNPSMQATRVLNERFDRFQRMQKA